VISFKPRPLYPQGKSPWYPLDRRWVGPRAVLDTVVKRKIPSPHRESKTRTTIVQPIATLTELSWLLKKKKLHKIKYRSRYDLQLLFETLFDRENNVGARIAQSI
jgi:hypothetical protein